MMSNIIRKFLMAVAVFSLLPLHLSFAASTAKPIEIKGEVIDTWCYFSGVMGGEDAVVGSAHHTCALWCAAGGIPVGVRTDEGEVFMVLKYENEDAYAQSDAIMEVQSDIITAKGMHYVRDGVNYLVVEKVVANDGIQVLSHEDYGAIPPNSFP
ncbi:MAG: hypothetical protein AAF412_01515, partial [Pseudomonadota bacterium]